MVQINIDTDRDSPVMIAKIIEMLHAHLGSPSQIPAINQVSSVNNTQFQQSSQAQSSIDSNPFNMFDSSSQSSAPVQSSREFNNTSLPSSAPVNSAPSMFDAPVGAQKPSSVFDVFGAEDRPNAQVSPLSDPFAAFDTPTSSTTTPNEVAGFADDNLFNAFSNDLPSTNPSINSSPSPSQLGGLESSFASAQSLLNDDFTPLNQEEPKEKISEKKSANFFNFEQY